MTTYSAATNTEWEILDDLYDALRLATIDGLPMFGNVSMATSDDQADEVQLTGTEPLAIIVYRDASEAFATETTKRCMLGVTLRLAARVASAKDERLRLKEGLRLANCAKNAIETDVPSNASAWGDDSGFHQAIEWGNPEFTAAEAEKAPWVIVTLPLEVGFALDTATSH